MLQRENVALSLAKKESDVFIFDVQKLAQIPRRGRRKKKTLAKRMSKKLLNDLT